MTFNCLRCGKTFSSKAQLSSGKYCARCYHRMERQRQPLPIWRPGSIQEVAAEKMAALRQRLDHD